MTSETENNSGGFLRWVMLGVILAVLAVTLSEGLRDRVLDAMFGAEEEFEYDPSSESAGDGTASNGTVSQARAGETQAS